VPGESEEPQNTALVMKDLVIYKEAMSKNDAVYWKKTCAEELEAFVKQVVQYSSKTCRMQSNRVQVGLQD